LLILDTPGEIPGLTEVAQAVAGAGVATVLKKDGTVWVWGSNWQQQFGFPAPTDQASMNRGWFLTPQQVPGIIGAVEIALGLSGRHTLVRLKDGTLRVWGNNDWGQLGTGGGTGYQPRPSVPKVAGVARIFALGNNSFAVRTDGSLWAWGAGRPNEWPLQANVRVPKPAPPDVK
jgi:alpha-tubulin suppressor-like RCC1 family protein